MVHFFATVEETSDWLEAEVERIGLTLKCGYLPAGGRTCFVWPRGASTPGLVDGVLVDFPVEYEGTLTMGRTGWKASAFEASTAAEGRRLHQQLTRSIRHMATVPLFSVSWDRSSRSEKPFAWGSPAVVRGGRVLRQWRDGAVTFEP